MKQLIFLELNEINFSEMEKYISKGKLQNFKVLFGEFGYSETISEDRYEELEPWIQWVTAHTGKSYGEHKVFRLGDIKDRDIPQIWEELEAKGYKVGAISPMNANNCTKDASFFIPDPWTETDVTGSTVDKNLYQAISQAVNDNAQSKVTLKTILWLLIGAISNARISNYLKYLRLAMSARNSPWAKAMFLDLLLGDLFIKQYKKKSPNFASLFLNAGAHIQHHYMFSSAVYEGDLGNPDWYVTGGQDPVLDVYELYDSIVGEIRRVFPGVRIMLATGLHQDPHPEVTYYWRLNKHQRFLDKIGASFDSVQSLMSRDFLVRCKTESDTFDTARLLESAKDANGTPLFSVDNRGTELFVMLTYAEDISDTFVCTVNGEQYSEFKADISFVAIKNGRHNGVGYFVDTGVPKDSHPEKFPLKETPDIIKSVFA
ncbi:MAG: hypothetical protein K6L80_04655 [Agarilytica sp.]